MQTKDAVDIANVIKLHKKYHHKVIWYLRKVRKCHSGRAEIIDVAIPGTVSRIESRPTTGAV